MADMTDQVFAGRVLELAQSVVTQQTTNVEKLKRMAEREPDLTRKLELTSMAEYLQTECARAAEVRDEAQRRFML